jgi:hypothetical protein
MPIKMVMIAAVAISVLAPWAAMAAHHDEKQSMKVACRTAVKAMGLTGDAFRAEFVKCRYDPAAYNILFAPK